MENESYAAWVFRMGREAMSKSMDEFESDDNNLLVWYIPELDEIKLSAFIPYNLSYPEAFVLSRL